jgi:hypothetical protein
MPINPPEAVTGAGNGQWGEKGLAHNTSFVSQHLWAWWVFGWSVRGEYAAKQDERHEEALKIFSRFSQDFLYDSAQEDQ